MERKSWFAMASMTVAAVAVGFYLVPQVWAHKPLPQVSAKELLRRAKVSMARDGFAETLSYQNDMLPSQANLSAFFHLPIPDANVKTINLYQASPRHWRMEEMNSGDEILAVWARSKNAVIAYQGHNNQRTEMHLPATAETAWSLWQLPSQASLNTTWKAQVDTTTMANLPVYRLVLTPRNPGTLVGTVSYWFQGRYDVPLGFQVTDRSGDVVLSAKSRVFTEGHVKANATPPTAGRLVAWSASPALSRASRGLSRASKVSLDFPSRVGGLALTSRRRVGSNALGIYGRGMNRVMVFESTGKLIDQKGAKEFLHPIKSNPGFQGVTDGVISIVAFHRGQVAMTLLGSHSQKTLAEWASRAWR